MIQIASFTIFVLSCSQLALSTQYVRPEYSDTTQFEWTEDKVTWEEAVAECQAFTEPQLVLAAPASHEELIILRDFLFNKMPEEFQFNQSKPAPIDMWFAWNDRQFEDVWVDLEGNILPINSGLWHISEPNEPKFGNEDCAHIYRKNAYYPEDEEDRLFNDRQCDDTLRYVCVPAVQSANLEDRPQWDPVDEDDVDDIDPNRSNLLACILPSCEDNDFGDETCDGINATLPTLGGVAANQCGYKCLSYASNSGCQVRTWIDCDFSIEKFDENLICKPVGNSGIVRSGCLGSCRSLTVYDAFSQYKSQSCDCCSLGNVLYDQILLRCYPQNLDIIDNRFFCKYYLYSYPVISSCTCEECKDIGYFSKSADYQVVHRPEGGEP